MPVRDCVGMSYGLSDYSDVVIHFEPTWLEQGDSFFVCGLFSGYKWCVPVSVWRTCHPHYTIPSAVSAWSDGRVHQSDSLHALCSSGLWLACLCHDESWHVALSSAALVKASCFSANVSLYLFHTKTSCVHMNFPFSIILGVLSHEILKIMIICNPLCTYVWTHPGCVGVGGCGGRGSVHVCVCLMNLFNFRSLDILLCHVLHYSSQFWFVCWVFH